MGFLRKFERASAFLIFALLAIAFGPRHLFGDKQEGVFRIGDAPIGGIPYAHADFYSITATYTGGGGDSGGGGGSDCGGGGGSGGGGGGGCGAY